MPCLQIQHANQIVYICRLVLLIQLYQLSKFDLWILSMLQSVLVELNQRMLNPYITVWMRMICHIYAWIWSISTHCLQRDLVSPLHLSELSRFLLTFAPESCAKMMFTYPWSFFTYSYGSIARYDVGEEGSVPRFPCGSCMATGQCHRGCVITSITPNCTISLVTKVHDSAAIPEKQHFLKQRIQQDPYCFRSPYRVGMEIGFFGYRLGIMKRKAPFVIIYNHLTQCFINIERMIQLDQFILIACPSFFVLVFFFLSELNDGVRQTIFLYVLALSNELDFYIIISDLPEAQLLKS